MCERCIGVIYHILVINLASSQHERYRDFGPKQARIQCFADNGCFGYALEFQNQHMLLIRQPFWILKLDYMLIL